jgi:hypothetical protein
LFLSSFLRTFCSSSWYTHYVHIHAFIPSSLVSSVLPLKTYIYIAVTLLVLVELVHAVPLKVCGYLYTCVYMCMCLYMYMYKHVYMHVYENICVYGGEKHEAE